MFCKDYTKLWEKYIFGSCIFCGSCFLKRMYLFILLHQSVIHCCTANSHFSVLYVHVKTASQDVSRMLDNPVRISVLLAFFHKKEAER